MDLTLEIARIVLPLALVGGIAVFVVLRMNHKYKTGTLGKKKVKSAQNLLDSLTKYVRSLLQIAEAISGG